MTRLVAVWRMKLSRRETGPRAMQSPSLAHSVWGERRDGAMCAPVAGAAWRMETTHQSLGWLVSDIRELPADKALALLSSRVGMAARPEESARVTVDRGLLTPKQTAQLLGVHPKTLPTLIRRDNLPCLWVGRRRRFDRGEVNRWLSARKEG